MTHGGQSVIKVAPSALEVPARAEKESLGLIHQPCPMNQVNVSEPVPHIWYRTECGAELFPAHAYHFGLIRSAGAFKTLTHIIERNNLILNLLPEFKAQVAIEALKEQSTLAELAKKYEVSPTMISHWKADLVKNAGAAFGKQGKSEDEVEKKNQELYAKIGKLEVMLDFAKRASRKLGIPMPADE